MGNVHKSGPNEAVVVSGGCSDVRHLVVGGWVWAWCGISKVQRMSLEVMSLNALWEDVEGGSSGPVSLTVRVQCKIITEVEELASAAETFLGEEFEYIEAVILGVLEEHFRAALSKFNDDMYEEVYKNRVKFQTLAIKVSVADMRRMGIKVLSFTIKDVFNDSPLGKSRIAAIKREADL